MSYKEQIDFSRIPQHVAIIMDGNEDGPSNVDVNSFGHQLVQNCTYYCRRSRQVGY